MPEFRRLRPRRQRDLDGFILSLGCAPFLSETKGMPLSAADAKARPNHDRKKKPGAIASAGLYPMDGGSVVVAPAVLLDDDDLLGVGMFPAAMTAAIPAVMMAAIHVTTLTSVLDDDFGVLGLGRRGHRHHKSDGGKRRQRENNLAHWVAPQ